MDGAPAFATQKFTYGTCSFYTSDIVFAVNGLVNNFVWSSNNFIDRSGYIWNAGITPGQPNRHYIATAIHELGHTLGLLHEDRWYSMMGADPTTGTWNDGIAFYGPYEDSSRGAIALYNKRPSGYSDLGISPFIYQNSDGEYAQHHIPDLALVSGGAVTNIPITSVHNGVKYWEVNRGQVIRIFFNPQNNGTTDSLSNVSLAAYLSADDNITFSDTLFGLWNFSTLSATSYNDTFVDVTIPTTASLANTYQYIGLYINANAAHPDSFSSNNTAQWHVFIK